MNTVETANVIEKKHQEAFQQQKWAELGALYNENAVTLMPDGRAINGRQNVVQNFNEMEAVENLGFEIKQCEESGDLCYEIIELNFTDQEGKQCTSEILQVLKRNADGG